MAEGNAIDRLQKRLDRSRRVSERQIGERLSDLEQTQRRDNNPQKEGATKTYTTSATPNVDDPIRHNLGRVPDGFTVQDKDAAADIYKGVNRWTDKIIFLRSTVGGVKVKLFIF